MKLLLDTNIIIHRETKDPHKEEIGKLFWWIDKLGYKKYVHQITIDEISRHQNPDTRRAFLTKMESYNLLPTQAPIKKELAEVSLKIDTTVNDHNDTTLLNEVFAGRVDYLITEDIKIHRKASFVGIDTQVFTIESFLEKVTAENPSLVEYKIPTIRKVYFGNLDLNDQFFESLREDYPDFEKWFNKKSDEFAYVGLSENKIIAFLYLKTEGINEPYPDIEPIFTQKKRLKVGTFKVELNGLKLGERFVKIIFDNALNFRVDEIYVTLFQKRLGQRRLITLFQEYGFSYHGCKKTKAGIEDVYTRDFSQRAELKFPKTTYPFTSRKARKFLVPIYPEYHTNLFPDSILRTESPIDFIENEPFRNAISKVYISRSIRRDMEVGDILLFYRTGGYYQSVVTTIGIVDGVHISVKNLKTFIDLCRKRSVFSDKELEGHWNYSKYNKPFVVNFLYSYSLPKRINLKRLIELGIIRDTGSAPRGFEEISDKSFEKIIRESTAYEGIVVD